MSLGGDLWEEIGALADEDAGHVLTRLFVAYESEAELKPDSEMCKEFFKRLEVALSQTVECNLNRR